MDICDQEGRIFYEIKYTERSSRVYFLISKIYLYSLSHNVTSRNSGFDFFLELLCKGISQAGNISYKYMYQTVYIKYKTNTECMKHFNVSIVYPYIYILTVLSLLFLFILMRHYNFTQVHFITQKGLFINSYKCNNKNNITI